MHYALGIDTSGTDTLAGVVIDGHKVASEIKSSLLKSVPPTKEMQFQEFNHNHLEQIVQVVDQAIADAGITYEQLDLIGVTQGPGLDTSLEVGITFAKGLGMSVTKPVFGVHHLEGHIYSLHLTQQFQDIAFPALVLVISGSATEYILMHNYGQYDRVGGTVDDTIGETIEKIGKVLGFAYPAGVYMEQAAQLGNAAAFNFPRMVRGDHANLSFNNLKLAVLNEITVGTNAQQKSLPGPKRQLRSDVSINDVAAALQSSIFEILCKKTELVAQKYSVKEILVVGGVAANQFLRQTMTKQSSFPLRFPPLHLCTNNGAMIAAAGFAHRELNPAASPEANAITNWQINEVRVRTS